jgi:hypothetical protein
MPKPNSNPTVTMAIQRISRAPESELAHNKQHRLKIQLTKTPMAIRLMSMLPLLIEIAFADWKVEIIVLAEALEDPVNVDGEL